MASLFTSQTPDEPDDVEGVAVILATTVAFSVNGQVTHARFYMPTTVAGDTFTANLYQVTSDDSPAGTGTGTSLAGPVTFTGVTGGAWNTVAFASPVSVTTGNLYRICVHSVNGRFTATKFFFSSAGLTNGNITAYQDGTNPIGLGTMRQGTYRDNATMAYPSEVSNGACYFVDVVFNAGAVPAGNANVTVTANNPSVSVLNGVQVPSAQAVRVQRRVKIPRQPRGRFIPPPPLPDGFSGGPDATDAEYSFALEREQVGIIEDAGFPDVIVEFAPANDFSETHFAPTGFTEITQFVTSVEGSLRQRTYEIGQIEAGSINVQLDNSDGRFTVGSKRSPYFPNIKANRRFRIRGRNMANASVATGGGKYRSTVGFFKPETNNTYAADPVLGTHNAFDVPYGIGPYHIEATWKNGAPPGVHRLLCIFIPLELATQLAYSAYVWRVGGTGVEPTAAMFELALMYYDEDDLELGHGILATRTGVHGATVETPVETTPIRFSFTEQPPATAKYAQLCITVDSTLVGSVAGGDVVYAVTGVQVETLDADVNLVPFVNEVNFNIKGPGLGTLLPAANGGVDIVWGTDDLEAVLYIPRLTPGEEYTLYVELTRTGGSPDILVSADDGQTGVTDSNEGDVVSLILPFVANAVAQNIKFIPVLTGLVAGMQLNVNNVRLVRGNVVDLASPVGIPLGITEWQEPKPVFDGWTEDWPSITGDHNSTVNIDVSDRLSRLGAVELSHTLREALFKDSPELLLPLADDPLNTSGEVSQLGTWGTSVRMTSVAITGMNGDLTGASYELGVEGPTSDTALEFTRVGDNRGYKMSVPYSADYTPPPPLPVPKPPVPPAYPPASGTTEYTMSYYATWSRSFDGSNAPRFDDASNPNVYQGNCCSGDSSCCGNGMLKGLIGFNNNSIEHDLAGAVIKAVHVTLYADHWWWFAGGYGWLGTHNYTSKPSTWSSSRTTVQRWKSGKWARDSQQSIDIGVPVGYDFAAGRVKGIAIGPAPNNSLDYYGYFNGATEANKPFLTIKFAK